MPNDIILRSKTKKINGHYKRYLIIASCGDDSGDVLVERLDSGGIIQMKLSALQAVDEAGEAFMRKYGKEEI